MAEILHLYGLMLIMSRLKSIRVQKCFAYLEGLTTDSFSCLRDHSFLGLAEVEAGSETYHVVELLEGTHQFLMVVRPLDILANESPILLLDHGVILPHVLDIVDYQTGFGLYHRHLQILNALRDVGREVSFQLIALLYFFKNFFV